MGGCRKGNFCQFAHDPAAAARAAAFDGFGDQSRDQGGDLAEDF